jgi:hypothetical protein
MVGAFPLPGANRWRLMAPAPADTDDDLAPEAILALITALLAECTGHPASIVQDACWTSTFRIHHRLADTYRRGRDPTRNHKLFLAIFFGPTFLQGKRPCQRVSPSL